MRDASESVHDSLRPARSVTSPCCCANASDMLAPAIERPGAVLVDGTLGMGGHTEGALERFEELTVIGIDRDPQAIELASARLQRFGTFPRSTPPTTISMRPLREQLSAGARVDGVSLDLGCVLSSSSMRLTAASPTRRTLRSTCEWTRRADGVRRICWPPASEGELIRILRTYSEEVRPGSPGSSSAAETMRPSLARASLWTSFVRRSGTGEAHGRQPGEMRRSSAARRGQRRIDHLGGRPPAGAVQSGGSAGV